MRSPSVVLFAGFFFVSLGQNFPKIQDFIPKDGDALQTFLSGFDFQSGNDVAGGYVWYTTKDQAMSGSDPLVSYDKNTGLKIRAMPPADGQQGGPQSVKLLSHARIAAGQLLIVDLSHMPAHCGSWPGIWMLGPGQWPAGGEIDFIEGIGGEIPTVNQAHTALHTMGDCIAGNVEGQWTSKAIFAANNCNYGSTQNSRGCVQINADNRSYGREFNTQGGGVYAFLWTESYMEAYFFTRSEVPQDIKDDAISADSMAKNWGLPYSRFNFGSECASSLFGPQQLIIDLDFCGGWAGNAFKDICPTEGRQVVGPAWDSNTAMQNCMAFLQTNQGHQRIRNEAYFGLNGLKVYKFSAPKSQLGDVVNHETIALEATPCIQVSDNVEVGECVAIRNPGSNGDYVIGTVTNVQANASHWINVGSKSLPHQDCPNTTDMCAGFQKDPIYKWEVQQSSSCMTDGWTQDFNFFAYLAPAASLSVYCVGHSQDFRYMVEQMDDCGKWGFTHDFVFYAVAGSKTTPVPPGLQAFCIGSALNPVRYKLMAQADCGDASGWNHHLTFFAHGSEVADRMLCFSQDSCPSGCQWSNNKCVNPSPPAPAPSAPVPQCPTPAPAPPPPPAPAGGPWCIHTSPQNACGTCPSGQESECGNTEPGKFFCQVDKDKACPGPSPGTPFDLPSTEILI